MASDPQTAEPDAEAFRAKLAQVLEREMALRDGLRAAVAAMRSFGWHLGSASGEERGDEAEDAYHKAVLALHGERDDDE